jgi:putative Holliday junction resolvase
MASDNTTFIGLDVGEKRIGVAKAHHSVRLASPLTVVEHGPDVWSDLQSLCQENQVSQIVVGLPRGLDGQSTAQTQYVERFVEELKSRIGLTVHLQDEAVTSKQAEAELEARKKPYNKGDIDALAATYILQDYLETKGSTDDTL